MSARWGKTDSKPKLLGWPVLTDAVEKGLVIIGDP
jgi:hypothetical protein